jgi:hypothetical protein|tara:strand:+ start:159 stop:416 length:258 start_codon:yes stop_codon:yes gene_type:complete
MKKRVISKNTIKVGKKSYTEEKYWAMFPSDRIITTRTRKITMGDVFNVCEFVLISAAGFFLLKFMFDFGAAMEAWSELDTLLRGY